MRIMIHFGETLPDSTPKSYEISAGLLMLWACTIFCLMLATFGIGAASGPPTFQQFKILCRTHQLSR